MSVVFLCKLLICTYRFILAVLYELCTFKDVFEAASVGYSRLVETIHLKSEVVVI